MRTDRPITEFHPVAWGYTIPPVRFHLCMHGRTVPPGLRLRYGAVRVGRITKEDGSCLAAYRTGRPRPRMDTGARSVHFQTLFESSFLRYSSVGHLQRMDRKVLLADTSAGRIPARRMVHYDAVLHELIDPKAAPEGRMDRLSNGVYPVTFSKI
jgi:hypothetical protein